MFYVLVSSCAVQTDMYLFRPIWPTCKLASSTCQLADWSADLQIALYNLPCNYPGICLICNMCQPISFHSMKISNTGRQQSEILTIVLYVNISRKSQLVSCHSLCRISTFSPRYFNRTIISKISKVKDVALYVLKP